MTFSTNDGFIQNMWYINMVRVCVKVSRFHTKGSGFGVQGLGVWVFGCLGVWVFGCLGVWVFGCLGVWVFGCLGVWVFGCLGVQGSGVQVFRCLGV